MSQSKRTPIIALCLLLLGVATQIQSVEAETQTYYYHNDHLGTPQVLTDKDQKVVWKGEYDPFGKVAETINCRISI